MDIMALEQQMGFRSSFNFVPERYQVSVELRNELMRNGFEIGVHGLYHDGKYIASRNVFLKRAVQINKYIHERNAAGQRSPSMLCNLEWMHDLNIEYDSSTFDTDPFELQPNGMHTIFPLFIRKKGAEGGYVELPYTLCQDFTLFILMREASIDIWKEKLDWIAEHGGMALMLTHPDYMNFTGEGLDLEEYPAGYYGEMLEYITSKYDGQYWHVLPKEMCRFWSHDQAQCRVVEERADGGQRLRP